MEYQTSKSLLALKLLAFQFPSRPLVDGDIINIDVTVFLDGYHGDTSQTFLVGNVVRCIPLFHASC